MFAQAGDDIEINEATTAKAPQTFLVLMLSLSLGPRWTETDVTVGA
jgi:hypothetical protein